MSVSLDIPEDIASSVRVPPQEVEARLRLELALALYQQELLSSGKACALAGMTRLDWDQLLGARKIGRHYAESDLAEDTQDGSSIA